MPVAPTSVVTLPNGNIPGSAPGVVSAVRSRMPHTQEKDLPGPWVVQKFGGTSIGKFAEAIARDVVGAAIARNRIAVVCSARSSHTKSEGTTNRLLRAAREAEKPKSRQYIAVVNTIQDDHLNAAKASIKSGEILSDLIYDIKAECAGLIKILESAQHLEEVSARAEDKIVSKGEKLSCLFMKAMLEDHGIQANYIDIADLIPPATPSNGGYASPLRLDDSFYMDVAKILGEKILASGRGVPVITGYFGNVPGGLLNNLGRGYTDLCAALVAVGLQASELQIWKEVDGIFTADPRKVPTARLLETVTPAEAAELTFYGSEVIHPFTMQQVIRNRIPIRVKNVINPRCAGTVIYPDKDYVEEVNDDLFATAATKITRRDPGSMIPGQRPKRPTAITVKHHIVILNVHSNKRTRAHGFLMNIFRVLDKWHLSVDLISSSEVHVSLALHSESALLSGGGEDELKIQDESLEGAVKDLREFGAVDLMNNMAIVSLVGKQLKNMVGISGKFFSTLGKNNINIEMISQGASEINISCVVEEREADRALNVVHTSLFTFLES